MPRLRGSRSRGRRSWRRCGGERRDAMASPTTYVPAVGILRAGGKLADAVEHTAYAAGTIGKRGAKAAAKRTGGAAAGEVAEHTDEAAARGCSCLGGAGWQKAATGLR